MFFIKFILYFSSLHIDFKMYSYYFSITKTHWLKTSYLIIKHAGLTFMKKFLKIEYNGFCQYTIQNIYCLALTLSSYHDLTNFQ